jgi:hypothetical protein
MFYVISIPKRTQRALLFGVVFFLAINILGGYPDIFKSNLPFLIQMATDKILMQTKKHDHKAAVFAFGPMPPALIGQEHR